MAKLAALNPWQRLIVLVVFGAAVAITVWCLVWVVWTIRPLLTAAAGLAAVTWVLIALRRHRARNDWHGVVWIGS